MDQNEFNYKLLETSNFYIYFGFNRLSIMDLSALGSQPMEYKNLNLMFNGMIYNHRELKNNNKYNLIGRIRHKVLVNEIYKKWISVYKRYVCSLAL